jgi:hypothetical protein
MQENSPSAKELRAYKIGARARKFAMEGCPIEGYEFLFTAIEEARVSDPALHALLVIELEKFESRLETMDTLP